MGGGGYEQLLLLQGEYGCLVNKNGPLARRKAVAQEDLRNYYFIAPNLREMREQPEDVYKRQTPVISTTRKPVEFTFYGLFFFACSHLNFAFRRRRLLLAELLLTFRDCAAAA